MDEKTEFEGSTFQGSGVGSNGQSSLSFRIANAMKSQNTVPFKGGSTKKDSGGVFVGANRRSEDKEVTALRNALEKKEEEVRQRNRKLVALTEEKKELVHALDLKEVEVQKERAILHTSFAEREDALRREIDIQRSVLKDRENFFHIEREALEERTKTLEATHADLKSEFAQRAVEHDKAISDLKKQREQYEADFQARMEEKATVYVDSALSSLKSNERRFETIGSTWSVAGLLSVAIGAALAFVLAKEGTANIVSNKDITWPLILFFTAKSAVLLGLIVAVVHLCTKLARSYMHESIKNGERRHAINYGKFYLSVYGAGTDGEKLKDVFAHWNIEGKSAFSEKDEQTPNVSVAVPKISEITEAVNGVQKLLQGGSK